MDVITEGTSTRLRDWRVREDLSLGEVSDLTGLSIGTLSKVERGLRRLHPLTKVRVARALGVPIRDLFEVEPIAADEQVSA